MEALLQLKPVTHNNQLRGLYDKIEWHVRALKALGDTSDSYGAVLASVLLSKLPSDLTLIVSRHVIEDDWELDTLMRQIEKEIKVRDRADTSGFEVTAPQK
uniref:Uncharacterized protein n=1 Tax=Amphimedon queenslandica TaxID=400682 RepID=A0A1X7UJJ2_AMPQE